MKTGLVSVLALVACSASARECIMYVGAHPDEFINEVGFGLHMLDGIDGELWRRTGETAAQLADLFRRYRPVAVFLQYPVDEHLDHVAAFTIGRHALRDAGVSPQVFLMNYRSQTSGMRPDYIVDISVHIEAKRRYCRTHACQSGEEMARQYADESAVLGAPFGMKYAEEYAVFDPPGNAAGWNKVRKTVLDEVGVRVSGRSSICDVPDPLGVNDRAPSGGDR